ncbi:HAD family phosphatase [[Clostridium] spiroforme]|nr:HAD family phosphatase [Thomasclavelia spiroformis]
MIKLIVCDVDGTSVDRFSQFHAGDLHKIKEQIEKGVHFMFASGRDMNMMTKILDASSIYNDIILNNGTQYRNYEGTINECHPMDEQAFRQMIEILQKYHYHISIHTTKGKYILNDFETYWNWHMAILMQDETLRKLDRLPDATFFTREGYLNDCTSVESVDEIYAQGAQPLKVDARHLNPEEAKGVNERLKVIKHLNISSSYEDNIEITCDNYDKGIMLKKVIAAYGFARDEVATFGDGLNDISMLEDFPYSFAPANAHPLVKEKVHYVLKHNGGDGAVEEGIRLLEQMKLL